MNVPKGSPRREVQFDVGGVEERHVGETCDHPRAALNRRGAQCFVQVLRIQMFHLRHMHIYSFNSFHPVVHSVGKGCA